MKEAVIETDPVVEGQIVLHQDAPLTTLPADGAVSAQAAMAMIELSRREGGQIDIETLRELRGMAKELRDEERLQWFSRELAAAQSECQAVVKAAEVKLSKPGGEDKGGYKYAANEDIDEMLRPVMTKYGFSVTYDREPRQGDGGGFNVTGTLWHRSGHFIKASFPLPLDSGPGRNNLQAAGSTDTYAQKYILIGFFRIVRKNADDDGFAAGATPIGQDQAARLIELVDEAKIAAGKDHAERRAAVKAWFTDVLSYEIGAYTHIRQEDYPRLARMLKSLADKAAAAAREEMKV